MAGVGQHRQVHRVDALAEQIHDARIIRLDAKHGPEREDRERETGAGDGFRGRVMGVRMLAVYGLPIGLIGAAPRQRGSSEAWTLMQPRSGASRIGCGRISP